MKTTIILANAKITDSVQLGENLAVTGNSLVEIEGVGKFAVATSQVFGPYSEIVNVTISAFAQTTAVFSDAVYVDGAAAGNSPAFVSTDASGNTVLVGAGGETIKLFDGEIASASGPAFSVPNGFTVGLAATPVSLTFAAVDTDGVLVDLAGDYINIPADATHVRVSANVAFAANATGLRYIAIEQYMPAFTLWAPTGGFNDVKTALATGVTPMTFNTALALVDPSQFSRLRVSVGQSSGGALNCTAYSVTVEFFTF